MEKQLSDNSSISDITRETQIMQLLAHPNIPTVLGVQLERKPYSIVMEFIGEAKSSMTIHQLIQSKLEMDKVEWMKISYTVADALGYIHNMGFLHCDLKSNNIVVSKKHGYIIDFGKACPISSPPAKKYSYVFPHIAPEVLNGSPCSKQSDIYSLGMILQKIGSSQGISVIKTIAKQCIVKNPVSRPTITGILSSLAIQPEVPLS